MSRTFRNNPTGGAYPFQIYKYTSSGTFNWTKPADLEFIELWLTGGGGGGGKGQNNWNCASGGAAGATAHTKIKASEMSSNTYQIVVGGGGNGGQSNGQEYGSNGGNSVAFGFTAEGGKGGSGAQGQEYNMSSAHAAECSNGGSVHSRDYMAIRGDLATRGGGGDNDDESAPHTQGQASYWGGGGGGGTRNCASSWNDGRDARCFGAGGGGGADRAGSCNGRGGVGMNGICFIVAYKK